MENAALIDELKSENAVFRAENSALKSENSALRSEIAEMQSKLTWIMEQLSVSKHKMFGASSEKSVYSQAGLFDDNYQEVQVINEPASEKKANRPKKQGELSSRLPKDMPVEIIECVLPDDKQNCPDCGGKLHAIGSEVARRGIRIKPASAVITEYKRFAYSCRTCDKSSDDKPVPVIKAELPTQVIKGSMCEPETVAHLIVQKCVMGSPLHRQEQEWNRIGLQINRQTMANWLIRCSEDYLEPIYDELRRKLLHHRFLHSDGTKFQVLREPGKSPQSQSQMWIYRTSGDAKHPIVLYDYQPDKTKERPKDFLEGFIGYLMTDGCPSYHSLPEDIIVVGCFSHCRRYFVDALKTLKEDDRAGSNALIGRQYCDELFRIEREMEVESFEERYTVRNEQAVPVLREFNNWLMSVQPFIAPKSATGKAVNYALKQWKYLERYLMDGCIEISNNRCERSIKPFVINRKNFLFATSVAGGRAAAVLHSMTETAKDNGLNPFEYLAHIFRTAAGVSLRENPDVITALLPENAPPECQVGDR